MYIINRYILNYLLINHNITDISIKLLCFGGGESLTLFREEVGVKWCIFALWPKVSIIVTLTFEASNIMYSTKCARPSITFTGSWT